MIHYGTDVPRLLCVDDSIADPNTDWRPGDPAPPGFVIVYMQGNNFYGGTQAEWEEYRKGISKGTIVTVFSADDRRMDFSKEIKFKS